MGLADVKAMWVTPKHLVNAGLALCFAAAPALASDRPPSATGGVAIGESLGGITDRAFVLAPPHWAYVVEREPGSFVDCGEGMDPRATDSNGRDVAVLQCGVTITETVVIPAAAASARIIIHY
jgi:hypothetical protein